MNARRPVVLLAALLSFPGGVDAQGPLQDFVVRRGDQLLEGERPFRFISVNIPNLQLVEDDFAPAAQTAWGWPTEFELNDALETVRLMGGAVARTYVLSVRRKDSDMADHVYVRGPGEFNEEAFRTLDRVVEIAGKKGVRLIIPLVDNWKWQGGRAEYAAFRGKQPDDFWTDEQVIADFEQTVRHVLSRVNTRTGVAYRDDPAILGWETGNELDSPPPWTRRISALMKRLDPNHLVIDGNSLRGVPTESLDDPNVDVITTHHYPDSTGRSFGPAIVAAREQTAGKKPYFVGEFGFTGVDEVERVYNAVIEHQVSGALIWSLRYHHRNGGFYWHSEPAGGRLYKAYHWPGFASGAAYEERRAMELTQAKAFAIRGLPVPDLQPPAEPALLPLEDPAAISWQGSAGACDYTVERATSQDGPWRTVGHGVDDAAVQYRPLFSDERAEPGEAYYYRVIACNEAGRSKPSNVVGPVTARHRTLVDECRDLSRLAESVGGVCVVSADARQRREDAHRLAIPIGAAVTYQVDGPIRGLSAMAYRADDSMELVAEHSLDGKVFQRAECTIHASGEDGKDYGYLEQLSISVEEAPAGTHWFRLRSEGEPNGDDSQGVLELSWIEIRYGNQ